MRCKPTTPPAVRRAARALALLLLTFAAGVAPARAERPKVLVAVLPFEVHSARPLGYLESSLADLLATRLEAGGGVQVVDSITVRESLVAFPGERTEDMVRRLAKQLGADWVVVGSLTELAGQYSLDVRVTPVESNVSTSTMVYDAKDDDELLDRVNELASRILSIVTGSQAGERVVEVKVEGAPDEGAAKAAVSLHAGALYDSGVVREDLAQIEALPGVATATVSTSRGEGGVSVVYRVVPTESLMSGAEAGPGGDRVARVEVRGNKRIEAAAILARIHTKAGDPYRPAQLAQDVRDIYGLGFFRNVKVYSEESIDGRVLVVQVEENPVVRQVTIEGNDDIDSEKIKDNLTLTTGSTLDLPLLFENRQRIEALYRAEGYYLARVRHEIEYLPNDAVAIHFTVDEGKKLKLREIDFVGNEHFSDEELSQGLKTKPWHWYSLATQYIDHSGTYSEPVFLQDLRTVQDKYLNAGYVQADVGDPDVVPSEDGLVVTVKIKEGDRFKVSKVDVKGDPTADVETMRKDLVLKQGDWFNRAALNADLERLESRYTDRGFYGAKVSPQTRVDDQNDTVDVVFQVEKGSLHFLREIDITGNTNTTDEVIRREMQMVEGELYSARAIDVSKARVDRLGFFEQVDVEPKPTDYPDQLDLGLKVVEKPTGSLSFGAGYSSRDGFIVSGSVNQSNLFGRGFAGALSADIGGQTDRYFLSLSDPYFLDTDFGLSAQVFRTSLQFDSYEQESNGAELVASHYLDETGQTRGFLRYSYAQRKVTPDNFVNAASVILRELQQQERDTSLIGLSFRQDKRNDRIAPTGGRVIEGAADFAGLGGFAKFLRFEGRGLWYHPNPHWLPSWFPFQKRGVWALGARMGWAIPFNQISDWNLPSVGTVQGQTDLNHIDTDLKLPLTERYFLGGLGAFQLRGFEARSVGPRRPLLYATNLGALFGGRGTTFAPVGTSLFINAATNQPEFICADDGTAFLNNQGNGNGKCNSLGDKKISDFNDLEETDVVGGNKFFSGSVEYRFPISDELGLLGIVFLDFGNAFAENEDIWDVGLWRFGTGVGALWFSPFGPLQAFVGMPIDRIEGEKSVVFEFSVGGQTF